MARGGFYVKDEGFEELFKQLSNMGTQGEKSAKKALKAGGDVFLRLARSGVHTSRRKSDKHLKEAIKVSNAKRDETGNWYVSVGTYMGRGKYRNGVYWGHIVEGGHVIKTKKGKGVGYVTARPFMQPAFERGQSDATKAISDIVFSAMGL